MAGDYLRGFDKKLARAETHLDSLKTMIRAWLDDHVDGWRAQVSAHGWGFAPKNLDDLQQERDRWADWSVIAGDVVHNLRSGLEHLAGALVQANGGRSNEETSFPVYKVRPTANSWGVHPLPNIVPVNPGVEEGARRILDAVQPYTFDDDWPLHPLWLLHAMWNHDKHRLLLLSNPWLTQTYSAYDDDSTHWQVAGNLEAIERGDDYTRFRLVPDWGYMDVQGETTLQIALGPFVPGESRPLTQTLTYLSDFVRDSIVGPLRPFAV